MYQQLPENKMAAEITISRHLYHERNGILYRLNWLNTSAGGLLLPEGIILPVVSASALIWIFRYIYY
jgi:hypothetical protein